MRYLISLIVLTCATTLHAQSSYSVEAWFWHNHLSTLDSTYIQDEDISNQASIPIHFQQRDFEYLDSVANAVGFWNLPDTLSASSQRNVGGAVFGQPILQPASGRTDISISTQKNHKRVILLSWPENRAYTDALRKFEFALIKVVQEQPYANTLPKPKVRQ